ncbi:HAMP domain-containing protein [Persicimonas caeni]|uniref:HAMP domain-containing protein n=1 Tax=Persicimonas caeni TaxID=2292766 RepID=A0A4Y6PSB1_PERCE|nr:methyl-accepting chemotaxis protein [Persicimonas caeni]QDG50999.1 HAMP domain-containing protein [Persicimonas caeni]QED32220.1 HAMP domain-containing protein [Persicimonas caeni]
MDKLWVRISFAIGALTTVAIVALVADQWIEVPKGLLATGVAIAGFLIALGIRRALAPLSNVTRVLEGIADGDLDQRHVPVVDGGHEVGRLITSTNRMLSQLNALSERAKQLADGKIGVLEVEDKVMRSERLSDADLAISGRDGDLERSFALMTNQLRRLTIQARMISKDRLDSPLLDEKVPGELGSAFGLMVKKLRTIAERAKDIADGDLTSTVDGDGELTSAFNQMVTGLRELVERITQTAIHISTAAEQILAVLREQEMAANHQASSVEETQRTMETLLSSAKKISENAQHVFKSAEKTQHNNRTIAERISELKNHTERINEILGGIKRIADRSDLLALNASLEGMRAGEAGKGFTLVAAEMRRLAENIKDSVGDIKELVEDIGESSMASAMATDEGTRLSENTTDNALKITLITQQQKSGTEQVTQSMDDLSELINQDVAGTQQVTMAASELADLAESLRNLVDEFRISQNPATSAEYKAVNSRKRRSSSNFRSAYASDASSRNRGGGLAQSSSVLDQSREMAAADLSSSFSQVSESQESEGKAAEEESSPNLRATAMNLASAPVDDTPNTLDEESSIPIDSGADQPTIEFATNMTEDEQRDVMRKMLAERRKEQEAALSRDDIDTSDLELDDDLDDFDVDDDDEMDDAGSEDSSVEDQIDALERELEKAGGELKETSEVEEEP